eukprot:PITA_19579
MAASSSTAASTSTSVNPNSTGNSPFDIFINHRGPDVKNTFASHLYHRLNSFGLKVFLDREELQQGEYFNSQIEGAIRTASVHVAIFSARYAESTWCLNELLTMLESQGTIIPVFYHVKPSELRWTKGKDGVYARDLQKLEEKTTDDPQSSGKKPRHDSATIEQWRKALSTVSEISGFELASFNSDEGTLLEEVVKCVMRNVKRPPLNVAKYPTGLDVKVRDFENKVLSLHQDGKPQVVGIVGLGGVGKTTLAKELFNWKSSHYTIYCFLDDVRENVGKGSLTMLQNKLLSSLIGSGLQVDNKDVGIEMLKMHLRFHQILLVLDDVDTVDQVDALVPDRTRIHPNSLIMITTRDKDVLTGSGIEESSIYKQKGLNKQHSLELFCCHALGQPYPHSQFEDLAVKFVNACDGLPLSLKVFGALLAGKNERSYWEMQLKKLENILPKDIEERLRISYDALDEEEKQIFLDVACFFNGENRDTAITIWNVSDWDGCFGLQNLQNKCLVEAVEEVQTGSWTVGIMSASLLWRVTHIAHPNGTEVHSPEYSGI